MKLAYSAATLVDARLVFDMFEQAGISAQVFNENQVGGLGDLPVTYPEVWIKRNTDFEHARNIVINFEQRAQSDQLLDCAKCGESNPATFEICWQCHHGLDQPAKALQL